MGKKVGFTIKREMSLGTLIQILLLLVSGIFYVARVEVRTNEVLAEQQKILSGIELVSAHLDRIEKYLSSRDAHYWQTIKQFEDAARENSRANPFPKVKP
jgi:hypothetical protein